MSRASLAKLEDAPEDSFQSEELQELRIAVAHAPGAKCARCWNYSQELGVNPEHDELCPRCTAVLVQE